MAIPYTQASMANVRAIDGTFISYPFIEDGDTTTKVYNLICSQRASDYAANQLDLDDPMTNAAAAGVIELPWPGDSGAFFVGDTAFASQPGGMLGFTRTFCNIPQSTTTPSGSAFVTFPEIRKPITYETSIEVTGISMTAGIKGVTLTTATAHSLAVDDNINATINFTVGSDPFIHSVSGSFQVLTVPATTTLIIDIGHYWNQQETLNIDSGRIGEASVGRGTVSRNVSTQTRYDYILPGVSPGIATVLDVNLPPAFTSVNTAAGVIDFVVDDITIGTITYVASMPSATEYIDMIINDANIVIESSLAEWAGNILVQTTKTCKAR